MLFKFKVYYDYTNNSIEGLEADDVEEAYQAVVNRTIKEERM